MSQIWKTLIIGLKRSIQYLSLIQVAQKKNPWKGRGRFFFLASLYIRKNLFTSCISILGEIRSFFHLRHCFVRRGTVEEALQGRNGFKGMIVGFGETKSGEGGERGKGNSYSHSRINASTWYVPTRVVCQRLESKGKGVQHHTIPW